MSDQRSALAGAGVAALSGLLTLRTRGLTLIMLSVAFAQVLLEIASKAAVVTRGDDGLADIPVAPVFGLFAFDFRGRVGFGYTLAVLVLVYFCLRRLVASPFGLTCRGIKGVRLRVRAVGAPVFRHLLCVYTIGGAFAGIAGALSAQTTQVVGLSNLGFELSAEGMVMLAIGGANQLASYAGVPESESGVILDLLARLPVDLPILLIEHDMELVFRFARRVIVLVAGAILFEGTPAEVAANEEIRDIYCARSWSPM
jgi:branched-subunit amino acid ABC-type transport system permease component